MIRRTVTAADMTTTRSSMLMLKARPAIDMLDGVGVDFDDKDIETERDRERDRETERQTERMKE